MSQFPQGNFPYQQNVSFWSPTSQPHSATAQFYGRTSSLPSGQAYGSPPQFIPGSFVSQSTAPVFGANPMSLSSSSTLHMIAANYGGNNSQAAHNFYIPHSNTNQSSHPTPVAFQSHSISTSQCAYANSNWPSQSSFSSIQYNNVRGSDNHTALNHGGQFGLNIAYDSRLSGGGNMHSFGDINCVRSQTKSDDLTKVIRVVNEQIWNHVQMVMNRKDPVCVCPICLEDCIPGGRDAETMVIAFNQCNEHQVHLACLNRMMEATPGSHQSLYVECPHCKRKYGCGVRTGNQPPGEMTWTILNQSLPGHPHTKTIQITYQIYSGIQDSTHPNPGQRFSASNFPRICFLPDTEKGRLVRDLLKVAFDRKLIFTIGTSATTGRSNVVIWNDIHHKTEWTNVSGHGYPDPGYLDRCLDELANQGVTSRDLSTFSY